MRGTCLLRIYDDTKENLAEAKRKHIEQKQKHVTYDAFVQELLDVWKVKGFLEMKNWFQKHGLLDEILQWSENKDVPDEMCAKDEGH